MQGPDPPTRGVFRRSFAMFRRIMDCAAARLSFPGPPATPSRQRQDKGKNPHVSTGHKVQPQDKLRPCRCLCLSPAKKPSIASAYPPQDWRVSKYSAQPGCADDFHRQICPLPAFCEHIVKIGVKTQNVLGGTPGAHNLQVFCARLRVNGLLGKKPSVTAITAAKAA